MRFFFYGTLIAGSHNATARLVHDRLQPLGAASVPGALWAISDAAGWYPALVTAQGGQVHGMLYETTDEFTAADLAQLDKWEDFRADEPAASLYLRQALAVTDLAGAIQLAQVYRYNRPLPATAQPIPEGNFQAWLEVGGRAEFGG